MIDATRSPDLQDAGAIRVPYVTLLFSRGTSMTEVYYWQVVLPRLCSPVPPPIGHGGHLATWTRFQFQKQVSRFRGIHGTAFLNPLYAKYCTLRSRGSMRESLNAHFVVPRSYMSTNVAYCTKTLALLEDSHFASKSLLDYSNITSYTTLTFVR